MHGSQNKWPHIVERISSNPKTSKQIGHFAVPGRFGDTLFVDCDAAAPVGTADVDCSEPLECVNDVSGVSHKSIVAIVRNRCDARDSVTKITSSSSSFTIGRTVLLFVSSMSTTLSVSKTEFHMSNTLCLTTFL